VDNVRFHNVVYNRTVIVNRNVTRVSYNGGNGIHAQPTRDEQRWSHEQHTAPLAAQRQNEMRASQNRQQFANVNHGRPATVAHTQPVAFNRSASMNNRPVNTMPANNNRSAATMPNHTVAAPASNRPTMNNNVNRPAFNNPQRPAMNSNPSFNRGPQQTYRPQPANQRPAMTNPNFNRGPQQTYRPQPQAQYHAAPQQMHQAPQQSRPQEFHGGGHEGGHGGHGR
jgi:hypothetical protein